MNLNDPFPDFANNFIIRTSYYRMSLSKREKIAILRKCKKNDTAEILDAICSHCRSQTRTVVKKDTANPHYGCIEKCCAMLYQWNMCAFCIQDTHFPVSEETRNAEVARFQRNVSRLPDDVQRYISEFIPHVFYYFSAFDAFRRNGRFFASLDKYLKLPKSTWMEAYDLVPYTKGTTKQKICDGIKEHYKSVYNYNIEFISCHQMKDRDVRNPYCCYYTDDMPDFEEIKTILTSFKKKSKK
jgi:hypothetical protein